MADWFVLDSLLRDTPTQQNVVEIAALVLDIVAIFYDYYCTTLEIVAAFEAKLVVMCWLLVGFGDGADVWHVIDDGNENDTFSA